MNYRKCHKFFYFAVRLVLTLFVSLEQTGYATTTSMTELPYGRGNSLWLLGGIGVPGNDLEVPSQHLEAGADFSLSPTFWWGPFYQLVNATKKETVNFLATGYQESRESSVKANVIGLQMRWELTEANHIRLGIGQSQTQLRVQSVSTNAPVPSTAVGLELKPPSGSSLQLSMQRLWETKSGPVGAEVGYNITSLSSNDSFAELYFAAVMKFTFSQKKSPPDMLPSSDLKDGVNVPMPL